jgi:hypothetical protein
MSLALEAARPRPRARRSVLTAERFVSALLFICLILQRFAVPFGSLALSVAAPLGLLLAAWGLASGVLTIDRRRAGYFLGLCMIALVATAVHANLQVAIAPRTSLNSLIYWLAITSLAALRLRTPIPEERFFDLVSFWLTVVAVAGLLAFVGQFVGLTLFTFSHIVPERFLIENQYAVVIPLPGSGFLRANGFFLVEPSVFSQFMAVGLIVEWLYFRRPWRLALYAAALLSAVSGTGWLVLGAFLVRSSLTTSPRNAARTLALVVICVAAVVVAGWILPAITESLTGRMDELSETGSSGYARFVTPFMALGAVLRAAPWSAVTGLGPGASQGMWLPFQYWLNTPVKIMIEYGALGLSFYIGLLLAAARTARQGLLVVPLIVLLMFTGGYQEFPPILFVVILITTVAALREEGRRPVPLRARSHVAHGQGPNRRPRRPGEVRG